jgi:hypothetical protein
MKIPILTLDVPNKNGRIYPRATFEKALKKYLDEQVAPKRAMIVSKIPEDMTVNLHDVIGVVKDIRIEENQVVIEAQFLPELKGALLAEEGINSGKLHLRSAGVGSLHKQADGTYTIGDDYEILSFFVTDNPA